MPTPQIKSDHPLDVSANFGQKDEAWAKDIAAKNQAMQGASPFKPRHDTLQVDEGAQAKINDTAGGTSRVITLKPGKYDKALLATVLKGTKGKKLTDKAIIELAYENALFKLAEGEKPGRRIIVSEGNGLGPEATNLPASANIEVVDGKAFAGTTFASPFRPICGTVFEGGKEETGIITSKAEYLAALPALLRGGPSDNNWLKCIPSERVAHLADQSLEVMAMLKEMMLRLPEAEVYSILPVSFRYYSDGDMDSQKPGKYGVRGTCGSTLTSFQSGGGGTPMLYDGPAYLVGLKLFGKAINGRVMIEPDGSFIASEWCQREVDKSGGIDLISGGHMQHTLLSWCAGPGVSRFHQWAPQGTITYVKVDDFERNKGRMTSLISLLRAELLEHPDLFEPIRLYWEAPDPADASKVQTFAVSRWKHDKAQDLYFGKGSYSPQDFRRAYGEPVLVICGGLDAKGKTAKTIPDLKASFHVYLLAQSVDIRAYSNNGQRLMAIHFVNEGSKLVWSNADTGSKGHPFQHAWWRTHDALHCFVPPAYRSLLARQMRDLLGAVNVEGHAHYEVMSSALAEAKYEGDFLDLTVAK